MPLYPLTPTDVQDKLDDLYAMSDPALATEATAIAANFISWIDANFSLTGPQGSYLRGINSEAIKLYGYQCAIAFRHRLPIYLIYPAPPGLGYTKWTVFSNDMVVKVDATGVVEATGSLTFEMEYRP
jgi:hypothetical protein